MGTRDYILDAAAEVLRTQGFARATTKSIAQVAGYSEAALYKHFADKAAILLAVMHERMPELPGSLKELIGNPGSGTVRANLTRLARTAVDFYVEGFPILVSLFSSQELLAAHRRRMQELERRAAPGAGRVDHLSARGAEAGAGSVAVPMSRRRRRCCSVLVSSADSRSTSAVSNRRMKSRARSPPLSPRPSTSRSAQTRHHARAAPTQTRSGDEPADPPPAPVGAHRGEHAATVRDVRPGRPRSR